MQVKVKDEKRYIHFRMEESLINKLELISNSLNMNKSDALRFLINNYKIKKKGE